MRRFITALSLPIILLATTSPAWASTRYLTIRRLPELRAVRINGACAVKTNGRGVVGTLERNGRFCAGVKARRTKAITSALRRANRSCINIAKRTVPTGGGTSSSGSTSSSDSVSSSSSSTPSGNTSTGTGTGTNQPQVNLPAIPMLAQWKQQMLDFGRHNCDYLKGSSGTFDERLMSTYYDAEWVFYQIADYTGDTSWNSCAQAAEKVYRDQYVMPANGQTPGYWTFSHGLLDDYLRTNDAKSLQALNLLATNASFASDATPLSYTESSEASRETAYAIMAYLNQEAAGGARRSRLAPLVNQALAHIDQWCVSNTAPFVRPFMMALTSHALIQYQEAVGDPRIVPAIKTAMDWAWDHTWLPDQQAFMYTDRVHSTGGMEAAPDLNLLIAPVYAWLYRQTGESRFLQRGDAIFAGGVKAAFLSGGKQFNQNYRRSIEFVKLRGGK